MGSSVNASMPDHPVKMDEAVEFITSLGGQMILRKTNTEPTRMEIDEGVINAAPAATSTPVTRPATAPAAAPAPTTTWGCPPVTRAGTRGYRGTRVGARGRGGRSGGAQGNTETKSTI